MDKMLPLMQREWLQHRFGWMLMAAVPLGLAALLAGFGQINIDGETVERVGAALPTLVALVAMAGSTAIVFVIAWIGSLIMISGLARRDHADRSIEFWMSLPVTHSASLAVPMLVHLLLVPAAALLAGLVGGWLLALIAVGRVVGLAAWQALPWPELLAGTFSLAGRLILGLPLATLWLLPLILLTVLLGAWFKRWAWVVLALGLGLGSQLLRQLFGQPLLSNLFNSLLRHAGQAMVSTGLHVGMDRPDNVLDVLRNLPAWAARDAGLALAGLATPLMLGALLFSAGCFWLLVQWRQRGGGTAG